MLILRGLECSCTTKSRDAEGGAAGVETGSRGASGATGTGAGGATDTGDVGRTKPLLRVTDTPVTRTDTGDFGSSSVVNKQTTCKKPNKIYSILTDDDGQLVKSVSAAHR